MHKFTDRGARRPPIKLPGGAHVCFTVDIAFEGFLKACQYRGGAADAWRQAGPLFAVLCRVRLARGRVAPARYPRAIQAEGRGAHQRLCGRMLSQDPSRWRATPDTRWSHMADQRRRHRVGRSASRAGRGQTNARRHQRGDRTTSVGWLSPGYAGSEARLRAISEAGIFYSCDDARTICRT